MESLWSDFRYEDTSRALIEGHARQVLDSVRQKDDKRRRQRLERQARKLAEQVGHRASVARRCRIVLRKRKEKNSNG